MVSNFLRLTQPTMSREGQGEGEYHGGELKAGATGHVGYQRSSIVMLGLEGAQPCAVGSICFLRCKLQKIASIPVDEKVSREKV